MATKRKTIEYGFQTNPYELIPGDWRELSSITLYIPESSITFKNVTLEWNLTTTSGSLINDQVMGINLGAGGWDDYTDTTNAYTYSSEREAFYGTNVRDLTSYFTSNWTGTSMTCQVRFKVNNVSNPYLGNIGATIYITYEYDDTSSTHIKTVRIPIESRNASCPLENTWYSVGTNQIPKLTSSGLLPEASITVRHMSINLFGMEDYQTTPDGVNMLIRIDTGSASYIWEYDYGTDCPIHAIYAVTSMSTTSTHDLQVQAGAGAPTDMFTNIGGWLTVTYEFDPEATTRVLNSLILPFSNKHLITSTTSSDVMLTAHDFYIPEPGTITLKQSGIVFQMLENYYDFYIASGSQSHILWDCSYNSTSAVGQTTIIHRTDAGGAAGSAGITLSGGENTAILKIYTATDHLSGHWRAYSILNYESDKADAGVGAHSHSVFYLISPQINYDWDGPRVHTTSIDITESSYLMTGGMLTYKSQANAGVESKIDMLVKYDAAEGNGDGWGLIHQSTDLVQLSENKMITHSGSLDDIFAPYPSHPNSDLMDLETSRKWRFNVYRIVYGTISAWITYSSATYSISGSIYGYTGDGSGISVQLYRASDHKHVLNATSSAGGGYSATWYDPNDNLYAATRQDATHVGRSDNGAAI